MASWYRLRHRETGEEQFVCGRGGIAEEEYDILRLDREPTEFDVVSALGFCRATPSRRRARAIEAAAERITKLDLLRSHRALQKRVRMLERQIETLLQRGE